MSCLAYTAYCCHCFIRDLRFKNQAVSRNSRSPGHHYKKKKKSDLDFPGGPVVKNPPANAGNMGMIPGSGRFHMLEGNNCVLCTTSTEPTRFTACALRQEKPPQW